MLINALNRDLALEVDKELKCLLKTYQSVFEPILGKPRLITSVLGVIVRFKMLYCKPCMDYPARSGQKDNLKMVNIEAF